MVKLITLDQLQNQCVFLQLWDSKLSHSKALDRARPAAPEPSHIVSPNRMQQPSTLPVTAPQLGHPSLPQLHQPGATAIQLARLQSQATGLFDMY